MKKTSKKFEFNSFSDFIRRLILILLIVTQFGVSVQAFDNSKNQIFEEKYNSKKTDETVILEYEWSESSIVRYKGVSPDNVKNGAQKLKKNPGSKLVNSELARMIRGLFKEIYLKTIIDPHFKIGHFPVAEFLRNLERVELITLLSDQIIQADPNRDNDFYLSGRYVGLINRKTFKESYLRMGLIVIHVILGSMGYNDDNGQITFALSLYEKSLSHSSEAKYFRDIDFLKLFPPENVIKNPQQLKHKIPSNQEGVFVVAGGGATGIGGGGDSSSLLMKSELLGFLPIWTDIYRKENTCKAWKNDTDFVLSILNSQIESSSESQEVSFEKDFNNGNIYIQVPRLKNTENEHSRKNILDTLSSICVLEGSLK